MRNYNANLFYGLKISDDYIANQLIDEKIKLHHELELQYSGSEYYQRGIQLFVCIRYSNISRDIQDPQNNPINYSKMVAMDEWYDQLRNWAKENKILNPKIGWWLVVSEF